MLESEAKTKICPIMTRVFNENPGHINCCGSECVMWDQHHEVDLDNPPKVAGDPYGYKPKDPPEGDCGMKPPEMNCNYNF